MHEKLTPIRIKLSIQIYLLYLHSAIFDVLLVDFLETKAAEQREHSGSLALVEA